MRILAAGLLLATSMSTAYAADLIIEEEVVVEVPAAGFDWTGFYVGVNAGYAAATSTVSLLDGNGDVYDNGINGFAENDYELSNWTVGLSAGFLTQMDGFVLGVEGDVSWANLSDGDFEVFESGFPGDDFKVSIDALASLRAKLGIAADNALFYVTAGVAAGNVHTQYRSPAGGADAYNYDETAFGWTAGLGASFAVADNIVLTGEYRYTDLGETSGEPVAANLTDSAVTATTLHSVTAGVSFKF